MTTDPGFHSLQLGWLFNHEVLAENHGMSIIETYQEAMCDRSDLEPFKIMIAALHSALDSNTNLKGSKHIVQRIQIIYMLCRIKFSEMNKIAWTALEKAIKHAIKNNDIPGITHFKDISILALEGLPKTDVEFKKVKDTKNTNIFGKFIDNLISSEDPHQTPEVITYTSDELYSIVYEYLAPYFGV